MAVPVSAAEEVLSQKVMGQRLAMCTRLQGPAFAHCTPGWFHRHVVWMDPCSSILPGNKAQWLAMKQAAKGAKGYISDNAMMENANLRGPVTALKQKTFVGRKMNWVILLARGRAAVHVLPVEWQLNGEGMAEVASSLAGWLRDLLGPDAHLPRAVFTGRGTGMFSPAGHILPRYGGALRAAGLRSFFGADATAQAPDMGDLLLQETAITRGKLSDSSCLWIVADRSLWGQASESNNSQIPSSWFGLLGSC